jgi:hypothetical protein
MRLGHKAQEVRRSGAEKHPSASHHGWRPPEEDDGAPARPGKHGSVDKKLPLPIKVHGQRRRGDAAAKNREAVSFVPQTSWISDEYDFLQRVEVFTLARRGDHRVGERNEKGHGARRLYDVMKRVHRHDGDVHARVGVISPVRTKGVNLEDDLRISVQRLPVDRGAEDEVTPDC